MTPDPRWLEILKASSWQLGGIAGALAAFWLMLKLEVLPPIESPWAIYGVPLAFLITGGMSAAGLFEHLSKFAAEALKKRRQKLDRDVAVKREQTELQEYIPFMTEREKQILGYLLEKNQKMFTAETDASLASTLYARRFVRMAMKTAQAVDPLAVPFHVPDHLWEILVKNREQFPTGFPKGGRPPWRGGPW